MTDTENLTKIRVDLPNHWATGGEAMWAQLVGENLYELRNAPFYAYDLNFLDVVEAVSEHEDLKPDVRRVVRRSGHRTLRVFFSKAVSSSERPALLETLKELGATFEGATESLFAIDIKADGSYDAVCERLYEWEKKGLLEYETCEARVPGSFDDAPEGHK
jgi:uncharacterized protein DUF4265